MEGKDPHVPVQMLIMMIRVESKLFILKIVCRSS